MDLFRVKVVPLLMPDIIIKNNSGPRIVSWGAALKTGLSLLIPLDILTWWVLLIKNWKNHMLAEMKVV